MTNKMFTKEDYAEFAELQALAITGKLDLRSLTLAEENIHRALFQEDYYDDGLLANPF